MIRHREVPPVFVRLLLLSALAACAPDAGDSAGADGGMPEAEAELVLTNGKIATLAGEGGEVVSALASRDGRIVALGAEGDISGWIGEGTEVIDLGGRLAIPGFIEGHGHFMGLGNAQMILDLTTADTWGDIVSLVGEAASSAEPGPGSVDVGGTRRSGASRPIRWSRDSRSTMVSAR